jgi:TolB-like protein/cytochrome c-type biogenesis protein CcmH/NrfG
LTPGGVDRESDADAEKAITRTPGRRSDLIIISILCAAVILFAYDKWWTAPPPERSVAVLPFTNMSAEEDSAYFSDGLADTMLHMLAQVPKLRVPARTSSFEFRDFEGDVAEIGDQLNVRTILEGSVQLYGEKIRVTAQLIDVETGYHLWSRNFDRNFSDVFAIQDEIAAEVVSALRLTLLDDTDERLDREGTDNVAAYNEYLLAINNLNPGTTESFQRAIAHLQKAIELDPEYAHAHSTLGRIYLGMMRYGATGRVAAVANAKDAASRALNIAPESSDALAVLGEAELVDGNEETAHLLLEKAIENGPNNVNALQSYGTWFNSQLRFAEAENMFRRVLQLDPLQGSAYMWLATNLRIQKKIPEALEIVARWKEVIPNSPNASAVECVCYIWQGKYAACLQANFTSSAPDDPRDPDRPTIAGWMYLLMDTPDEARKWFDRAIERNPEYPVSRAAPLWLSFYQQQNEEESVRLARDLLADRVENRSGARTVAVAILLEYAAKSGRHETVLEPLDNLFPNLFDDPPYDVQSNLQATFFVGLALIQSGDVERGAHLMRAYLEGRDPIDEALWPNWRSVAARLALGDKVMAMSKFRELVRVQKWSWPGIVSQAMLKHSAIFDPIRDEPEFIELLDFYESNAAEQRRLLQEMDEAT